MSLVRKGRSVRFVLDDGRTLRAPAAHAMLHDTSGRAYPYRAVLVGPIGTGPEVDDPPAEAVSFLGSSHRIHVVDVALPPKALSAWTRVGDLRADGEGPGIFYVRTGKKKPGARKHTFNAAGLSRLMFGDGRATLYRHGAWFRVQLGGKVVALDNNGEFFGWP